MMVVDSTPKGSADKHEEQMAWLLKNANAFVSVMRPRLPAATA